MLRWIVLAAIVVVLWLLVEEMLRRLRAAGGGAEEGRAAGPAVRAEELVPCASCGTYVPRSRALPAGRSAALYCSESCRGSVPP